jgi:hypothetical protein
MDFWRCSLDGYVSSGCAGGIGSAMSVAIRHPSAVLIQVRIIRNGFGTGSYPASESLFKKFEHRSQRSGVSRGAFEDWITAMVCALAAETKEGEYLAMIERHTAGSRDTAALTSWGKCLANL